MSPYGLHLKNKEENTPVVEQKKKFPMSLQQTGIKTYKGKDKRSI